MRRTLLILTCLCFFAGTPAYAQTGGSGIPTAPAPSGGISADAPVPVASGGASAADVPTTAPVPTTPSAPADTTVAGRDNGFAPIHGPWGLISKNPADKLLGTPIEDSVYDKATKCKNKRQPGIELMTRWLNENSIGEFWGSYRCEMWGKNSASLHAENRAIDWHLNARNKRERADAMKIIKMLLAPDAQGNERALARRMGVEEIIFDCSYWGSWGGEFSKYSYCYSKKGTKKKHYDATTAHDNHIHVSLSLQGAAGKTSFWKWYKKNH